MLHNFIRYLATLGRTSRVRVIFTWPMAGRALGLGALAALMAVWIGGQTPATAGQRLERSIKVGNMNRDYIVYLPDNLAARTSWPVIMAFHPALATAEFMEKTAMFHATPGGENFIVVYPQGIKRTFNAGDCCGPAERQNVDDLGFYQAMIADLKSIAPIKDKIYITGFSNGAMMVYHILCKMPETVAAAAPFAAVLPMTQCNPGQVALLHVHGGADEGSPVDGGYPKKAIMKVRLGYMPPVIDTVRAVAQRNGCSSSTSIGEGNLGTSCTRFDGCPGNADAELCIIPGLGHVWPGAKAEYSQFGPGRTDIRGTQAIISFFLNH